METKLQEIANKFLKNRNDLLHGGYHGDFLVENASRPVFDDMTRDLEIRQMLIDVFTLGTIVGRLEEGPFSPSEITEKNERTP